MRTLEKNAKWFGRASSWIHHFARFLILISACAAVIAGGSLDHVYEVPDYSGDGRSFRTLQELSWYASKMIIVLPILTAFVTTVIQRMKWRDKWSICHTAAHLLMSEIYMFRMGVSQYDPSAIKGKHSRREQVNGPSGEEDGDRDGVRVILSDSEVAAMARELFSERCQMIYGTCIAELSDGGSLYQRRKRLKHEHRALREQRYTFREWINLKMFVEQTCYHGSWGMPLDEKGLSFSNWITGLRPYVENTLQDELLATLESMDDDEIEELRIAAHSATGRKDSLMRVFDPLRSFRRRVEAQLNVKKDSLQRNHKIFRELVQQAITTAREDKSSEAGDSEHGAGQAMYARLSSMAAQMNNALTGSSAHATAAEKKADTPKAEAQRQISLLQGEPVGLPSKEEARKAQSFQSAEDD